LVGIAASPALMQELKANIKQEYARISWHSVAERCMSLYGDVSKGRQLEAMAV